MEYSQLPEWNAQGVEPPQTKKNSGWQPSERPPAPWFNWLFHRIYQSFIEIRNAFNSHEEAAQGVHGLAPTESVESTAGAQAKADAAQSAAQAYAAGVASAAEAAAKSYADNAVAAHANRTDNPHQVTPQQIGAETPNGAQQKAEAAAAAALSTAQAYADNAVSAHATRNDNPHGVTKEQVGLGNVQNYDVASQAEAEAGSVNNKYMTPLRTKQAIDALFAGKLIMVKGEHSGGENVVITPPSGFTTEQCFLSLTPNVRVGPGDSGDHEEWSLRFFSLRIVSQTSSQWVVESMYGFSYWNSNTESLMQIFADYMPFRYTIIGVK